MKVEKPAYGSQANGRPQNPKLKRTLKYYLIKDKKLYQVKRRKDLYKFFSKTDFKTKSFVKKYRTKIKTKDLKHLVKNYNEQVAKTNTRVITKTEQK